MTDPLVAALVAVMPMRYDGTVTVEYAKPLCGYDACTEHNDIDAPAEVVAAKLATAALRALADELDALPNSPNPRYRTTYTIDVNSLRRRADKIESGYA